MTHGPPPMPWHFTLLGRTILNQPTVILRYIYEEETGIVCTNEVEQKQNPEEDLETEIKNC